MSWGLDSMGKNFKLIKSVSLHHAVGYITYITVCLGETTVSLKALLCAVRMYTKILFILNRELVFNWYEPVS